MPGGSEAICCATFGDRGRELIVGDDPVDETHRQRLVGVDSAGGEHDVEGAAVADLSPQQIGRSPFGNETDLAQTECERRARGRDAKVARHRHRGASAVGQAVDRGDRRLGVLDHELDGELALAFEPLGDLLAVESGGEASCRRP